MCIRNFILNTLFTRRRIESFEQKVPWASGYKIKYICLFFSSVTGTEASFFFFLSLDAEYINHALLLWRCCNKLKTELSEINEVFLGLIANSVAVFCVSWIFSALKNIWILSSVKTRKKKNKKEDKKSLYNGFFEFQAFQWWHTQLTPRPAKQLNINLLPEQALFDWGIHILKMFVLEMELHRKRTLSEETTIKKHSSDHLPAPSLVQEKVMWKKKLHLSPMWGNYIWKTAGTKFLRRSLANCKALLTYTCFPEADRMDCSPVSSSHNTKKFLHCEDCKQRHPLMTTDLQNSMHAHGSTGGTCTGNPSAGKSVSGILL